MNTFAERTYADMPTISAKEASDLARAAEWFHQNFLPDFYRTLDNNLPSSATRVGELAEVFEFVNQIKKHCTFEGRRFAGVERPPVELPEHLVPCVKRVLIANRRREARLAELQKEKTYNPLIIDVLDKETRRLDELLELPWLKLAVPMKIPRVSDFLSIESIQQNPFQSSQLADREYDEKFHILQAPKLLLKDLHHYREICDSRGGSVTVAYIDIDDFKKLNTLHSEIDVDRRVLPLFMRCIEEHVFHHGFAYRYGGDEYTVLLVNLTRTLAISFLEDLRIAIAKIRYPGIKETITISMGFCYVDDDCPLSDREIERAANRAKDFAKANGKNRIATFNSNVFRCEDLTIVQ